MQDCWGDVKQFFVNWEQKQKTPGIYGFHQTNKRKQLKKILKTGKRKQQYKAKQQNREADKRS